MLAIETLLGALTGYFTNDIAIRQLFSKNGMVVREREQFTTLIVQVLKNKIIDADTMDALRERPEMVSFFEEFVYELLSGTIPTSFLDKTPADYDINGAVQGCIKGRIADASRLQTTLDVDLVHEHVDACIQGEAFKRTILEAVQYLAGLSVKDLGLATVLEEVAVSFEAMDDDAWQAWLATKQKQVEKALAFDGAYPETVEYEKVKDVLSVDGDALVQKVEAYFGIDFSDPEQIAGFQMRYVQFLEQLYVFAARVLPRIFEVHLPTLVEAFFPMLQADRKWIEQMVLDSIDACNTDGNMILSVASGYVQKFFAPDSEGKDWLTKLYEASCQEDKRSVLCARLTDFLCGVLMTQIDNWRQLDLENEDDIKKVSAQYMIGRSLIVKGVNVYLEMPVQGNILHRMLLQGMISLTFAWLRQSVTVDDMQMWVTRIKMQVMNQSLESLFLNEMRQAHLVDIFCEWWHSEGMLWLKKADVTDQSLKRIIYKAIDAFFDTPISDLMNKALDFVPYGQLADGLRDVFFNHLRDFLAELTQDQLDALSHEEIREVVLDMIGREMRPLAYLGGGIGALAGVATGAAMQASGVTMDQEQLSLLLATRSGMYGAVGYGTNVMAVKGLFWPYKKTLGMQGLICKNQERFANKMKSMAESYIINDEIWMQQIERVSERISQHDDDIIRYGLHLLDKNRNNVLRPFVEMASHRLPNQVCKVLFEKKQVAKLMARLSDTGIQACLNYETISALATRFQLLHRGICKVAMAEAREHMWSDKIERKLHCLSVDDWVDFGNDILKLCRLPKNEAVYEKAWQRVLPKYRELPTWLFTYTHDIAGVLDRYVSKKLSFPLQLAYRMAGGDRQIERVVAHFIAHQLPDYIVAREAQVKMNLKCWARMQLSGRSLVECGVTVSEAQGQWFGEWIGGISADAMHQHVLQLLAYIEKWPRAYLNAMTKDAMVVSEPFLTACAHYLQQANQCQQLQWNVLASSVSPLLESMRKEMFRDISIGKLFAVNDEQLWTWCNNMLHLSYVEKESVIEWAQTIWRETAPSFWRVIGQRGRVLMMLIDIPTLTHDRICSLSPEELEVMVRDIAQPYFTRVERMGWLGAVVAVPATMISMILGGM